MTKEQILGRAISLVDTIATMTNATGKSKLYNVTTQEISVANEFVRAGYEEFDPKIFARSLAAQGVDRYNYGRSVGKKIDHADGFVGQPYSTQGNPDMFWVVDSTLFSLNFKAAKTNTIKFNSTLPRHGEFYVLSPGIETNLVFLGEHLISAEEINFVNAKLELIKSVAERMKPFNSFHGGRWDVYNRVDVNDYARKINYAKLAADLDSVAQVKERIRRSLTTGQAKAA